MLQLQRELLNQHTKTSQLLALALFVARKLKLNDVINILSPELNGYQGDQPVSPFRFIKGELISFDGKQEQKIALSSDHLVQYDQVRLSVSAIEELCDRNEGEFFYIPIQNKKIESEIQSKIKSQKVSLYSRFGVGNNTFEKDIVDALTPDSDIRLKVNRINYLHILHTVRSIIQSWSIILEEQGFVGESFTFTQEENHGHQ